MNTELETSDVRRPYGPGRANSKALRARTVRHQSNRGQPLPTGAAKAVAAFERAKRNSGEDRGEQLILTAVKLILDCKQRVLAGGEYDWTCEQFCKEYLPSIEPAHIERLLEFASTATPPAVKAAAGFLSWQEEHIDAHPGNHVVSTVYSMTTYFKSTVPVMPSWDTRPR